MTNANPTPRPRKIVNTTHMIRAHWNRAKRSVRRRLAKAKQLQLVSWLAAGQHGSQHAI